MTGLLIAALLLALCATAAAFWRWQQQTALPSETAENPMGYQISTRLLQVELTPPKGPIALGEIGVAEVIVTNTLPIVLERAELRLPQPTGFEVDLAEVKVGGHLVHNATLDHGTVVVPLGLLQPKRRRTLHIPLKLVYTRLHAD